MARRKSSNASESLPIEENGNGAEVELKVKGSAPAAKAAIEEMADSSTATATREVPEIDESAYEDQTTGLLADPRNMVIVERVFPRTWLGQRCDGEVARFKCPVSSNDIRDEVFTNCGGHKFRVSIHPATPTGEHKILGAFVIENSETQEPFDVDEPAETQPSPQQQRRTRSLDPFAVQDEDPFAVTEQALNQRARTLAHKLKVKELEKTVKEMERSEGEEKEDRRRALKPPEDEIQNLKRKLDDQEKRSEIQQLKGDFEQKFSRLEQILAQNAQPKQDMTLPLLLEMMKSSQHQFTTMVQAQSQAQGQMMQAFSSKSRSEDGDMDKMLLRLKNMKEVFGEKDGRVNRFEDMVFDLAMNQINGGGGAPAEDEDPIKFAVKQMTPVFKTYVEKSMDRDKKPGMDDAEFKKLVHEKAREMALATVDDLQKKGVLVLANKQPPSSSTQHPQRPTQTQALPAPVGQSVQTPEGIMTTVEIPPNTPTMALTQQQTEVEQESDGDDDVKTPHAPKSPDYDRRKAVDFVLTTIAEDIKKGCPEDTFAAGDILDRLDDEMLEKFSVIDSGADMEALLTPWADPAKIAFIKDAGRDETVKSWLRRVIVTAQDVYLQKRKGASK